MAALESDRLSHVTIANESAYTCLIRHGLPVLRVEKQLPTGTLAIIWRNEPTEAEREKAHRLLRGVAASHAW